MAIKKPAAKVAAPVAAPETIIAAEVAAPKSIVAMLADEENVSAGEIRERFGIADDGSEDHLVQQDDSGYFVFDEEVGAGYVPPEVPAAQDDVNRFAPSAATLNLGHNGGPSLDSDSKLSDNTAVKLTAMVAHLQSVRAQLLDLKKAEKDAFAEAKSSGLDVSVLKAALKELELTAEEREEAEKKRRDYEQLVDLYVLACEERV